MSNSPKTPQNKLTFYQDQEISLKRLLGNPFEIGFQIGQILRQKRQWIRSLPPVESDTTDVIVIRDYLESYDPSLLDEIAGLASALGWEFSDAMIYFTGWNVMQRIKSFRQRNFQACTHFFLPSSTVGSNEPYLCRNFDFFYNFADRLFFEIPGNIRASTAGMSHQIVGRADGVNSHGVACSNSITTSAGLPPKGFSHPILTRIVLDCSHDAEEGIEILHTLPQSTSINYLIADQSGTAYVFEQSKKKSAVREMSSKLGIVATNHITSKDLQDKWSRPSATSGERYDYITSLLQKNQGYWSLESIQNTLQTHTPQVCDHALHKGVATLWSIIYNLKSFKIWINPGQPCINEYREFHLFPLENQVISGVYESAGHCGYRLLEKHHKLLYEATYLKRL
ncbi:MAG: C45 family autoproteolytic acyltransferase/hydrolase [Candidatus Hodarchaeota archaeon]